MTDTAQQERHEQLRAELATRTIYELLGGEVGLREIVDRFYELMDTDEAYGAIRAMHKPDLTEIRTGLFEWLSGWLGGPQLFSERKGSPCLVGAHLPLGIDQRGSELWTACMTRAMTDVGVAERYREVLLPSLGRIADSLRTDDRTGG